MRGNAVPRRTDYVAAIEGIYHFPTPGKEVVAGAAGRFAGGDRGGDCIYTYVDPRAISLSVSLAHAPHTGNFSVLP